MCGGWGLIHKGKIQYVLTFTVESSSDSCREECKHSDGLNHSLQPYGGKTDSERRCMVESRLFVEMYPLQPDSDSQNCQKVIECRSATTLKGVSTNVYTQTWYLPGCLVIVLWLYRTRWLLCLGRRLSFSVCQPVPTRPISGLKQLISEQIPAEMLVVGVGIASKGVSGKTYMLNLPVRWIGDCSEYIRSDPNPTPKLSIGIESEWIVSTVNCRSDDESKFNVNFIQHALQYATAKYLGVFEFTSDLVWTVEKSRSGHKRTSA